MKLRFLNYEIEPDNGSTFSLTTYETAKDSGKEFVQSIVYPQSLIRCMERIREDLRRKDKRTYTSIESFENSLKEIDKQFMVDLQSTLLGR